MEVTPNIKNVDTNSAAKPKTKSARKRRKASINFKPPKLRKKSAVAHSNDSDNVDHTDLIDFNVKDKTKQNEENEESSELSETEKESSKTSKTNETVQPNKKRQEKHSHRKTPATIQGNTLSSTESRSVESTSYSKQLTITSPELPVVPMREENCMKNEDVQTDKNFLQQQIQIFGTAFTLHDCPNLADKQDKRKNSIPHDVIQDALKKLNRKMTDEIQKHLNRQCQREVLSDLLQIEKDKSVCDNEDEQRQRKNHMAETMDISEILEKCSKELDNVNAETRDDNLLLRRYSNSVDELQTLNDQMKRIKQKIASYESNNLMLLEVESLARETTENSLRKEVERTSKLVNEILHRKANST
ncbi:uncharacterized protein LOC114526323 [Dendronephthya gigantea]|uniref:uncharacterized protein LOC114526323 n=1 Tax=Dendronephthya gigantea TaxID=151771 RepID=UPI00106CCEE3|nr:uncharacterized protein LOC114526323 [Dendronephthya gigantea]